VITWTFGSIPRIRICRDAGVAAVGPWNVTTHGSVSRCSTVSSSSTAALSAETTQTHSSR
jgi:hypothetical protein